MKHDLTELDLAIKNQLGHIRTCLNLKKKTILSYPNGREIIYYIWSRIPDKKLLER